MLKQLLQEMKQNAAEMKQTNAELTAKQTRNLNKVQPKLN